MTDDSPLPDLIPLPVVEDTLAFGRELGRRARAGTVVALCGGLGAGKTHLTKGIAEALGVPPESVSSPTFALLHEYRGSGLPLFHFDFYRMESPEEVIAAGWDDCLDEAGVCIAEWADLFPALMPPGTQWWRLGHSADGTREARRLQGPEAGAAEAER